MIKEKNIPTILGIVILLIGVFAGVFLLRTNQVFRIGASATAVPKDVRVSNLSDSSVTVSWITDDQTADFISYGETQNVGTVANETDNDQKFFTHSITITGLKAGTAYYYKIDSEGTDFDNNGVPWQFTTGPSLTGNGSSTLVSGSVITATGQPSARTIVYITINGYLLSTLTSDTGSFVLQLNQTRTSDLSSYTTIDPTQTLLEVSVEGAGGEIATAKIYPQSANPIPTLVMGQDQDYRNLQPTNDSQNPNANLNLPETATSESKFDISTGSAIASTSAKSVILESLNEGETVTSTQPQFFGKGPGGEKITITVHSEQAVSGSVTIPSNGSWSWSPSTDLAAGTHSIIITWVDATGITRSLTRDFVVQAGEVPAFTASGSGSSPTPTATPTLTPLPTFAPIVTATPTPAATFSPTPESTASTAAVPVTGDLTPTLLLFMMGVVVLSFSFAVWKMSES